MRLIAIANRETGDTELEAAMWNEDLQAWMTSDERVFEGPNPDESEGLIMAIQRPDVNDGLFQPMKEAVEKMRVGSEGIQRDTTESVSESHVDDEFGG